MTDRARQYSSVLPTPVDGPPTFPAQLVEHIKSNSPGADLESVSSSYSPFSGNAKNNPFIGKRILVLSGADDPLVAWRFSRDFVANLVVDQDGVSEKKGRKEVFVQDGAKHEVTPRMIELLSEFIWKQMLEISVQSKM
jgi:hypothetical protein